MTSVSIQNKSQVETVVKILLEQFGPIQKIILFGSWARGDQDEYSDLDLIVIKETSQRFVERLGAVPSLPTKADVFVYTPREWEMMQKNENPFAQSALESGKVIYEAT